MNQIQKLNYSGFAATFLAISLSCVVAAGCAPSSAVRVGPMAGATTLPINSSLYPQNGQTVNDLSSLNQQQLNQVNALQGVYTGSFVAQDSNYNTVQQSYTLELTKGTNTAGRNFVQANFKAGPFSFSSAMQVSYLPTVYGDNGNTFTFVSVAQSVPAIDPDSNVYLVLQLTLNGLNQFDPAQSKYNLGSEGPIAIVDNMSFYPVVDFNHDFNKR